MCSDISTNGRQLDGGEGIVWMCVVCVCVPHALCLSNTLSVCTVARVLASFPTCVKTRFRHTSQGGGLNMYATEGGEFMSGYFCTRCAYVRVCLCVH